MEPETGQRIEVFWTLDSAWYTGSVGPRQTRGKNKGRRMISYEDGEVEYLDFAKEKWQPAGQARKAEHALSARVVSTARTEENLNPSTKLDQKQSLQHERDGLQDYLVHVEGIAPGEVQRTPVQGTYRENTVAVKASKATVKRDRDSHPSENSAPVNTSELQVFQSSTKHPFTTAREARTSSPPPQKGHPPASCHGKAGKPVVPAPRVRTAPLKEEEGYPKGYKHIVTSRRRGLPAKHFGSNISEESSAERAAHPGDIPNGRVAGSSHVDPNLPDSHNEQSTASNASGSELGTVAYAAVKRSSTKPGVGSGAGEGALRRSCDPSGPRIALGTNRAVVKSLEVGSCDSLQRSRDSPVNQPQAKRAKTATAGNTRIISSRRKVESEKADAATGSTTAGPAQNRAHVSQEENNRDSAPTQNECNERDVASLQKVIQSQAAELARLENVEAELKETQKLVASLQPVADAIRRASLTPTEALRLLCNQESLVAAEASDAHTAKVVAETTTRRGFEKSDRHVPKKQKAVVQVASNMQELRRPLSAKAGSFVNGRVAASHIARTTEKYRAAASTTVVGDPAGLHNTGTPAIPSTHLTHGGQGLHDARVRRCDQRANENGVGASNVAASTNPILICQLSSAGGDRSGDLARAQDGVLTVGPGVALNGSANKNIVYVPGSKLDISSFDPGGTQGDMFAIPGSGSIGVGPIAIAPHHMNSMKLEARRLTARAATAWLLSGGYRGKIPVGVDPKSPTVPSWCVNTSAACLQGASTELGKHCSAEDADDYLATRLGSGGIELDWLSFPASSGGQSSNNALAGSGEEFIARARKNYLRWDPSPSEEEWAVESMIMREIGRRYTAAFVGCIPSAGDNVLKLSVRIAAKAAESAGNPVVAALASQQQ